jgi:hypothetical protein
MRNSIYQYKYDASVKALTDLLYNVSSLANTYERITGQAFTQATLIDLDKPTWDEFKSEYSTEKPDGIQNAIKSIRKNLVATNDFHFPESPLALAWDLFLIERGTSGLEAKINYAGLKQRFMDLAQYEIDSLEIVKD